MTRECYRGPWSMENAKEGLERLGRRSESHGGTERQGRVVESQGGLQRIREC